jgi:carbon-monoxide dehydrogenase small subunit
MGMQITLTVNGESVTRECRTEPCWSIREQLRLTGTHVGCDTAQCGACTVHIDGKRREELQHAGRAGGRRDVTTIEGLAAADGTLHPMQAAFREHHGLQCGFCTPGMVMSAVDLVKHPAQRRRDPRGPGRQPVPLHRLPQHREGRAPAQRRWPACKRQGEPPTP